MAIDTDAFMVFAHRVRGGFRRAAKTPFNLAYEARP
jgi:hypothetical protein